MTMSPMITSSNALQELVPDTDRTTQSEATGHIRDRETGQYM
jgi:hypothetical protein